MPPIRHGTLVIVNMVTALLGQWLLDSNPKPAILILGISLATALIDGWWYLFPLRFRWWYPALLGLIGLTMWRDPRGWFFLAWAAIELGTGMRAESFYQKYMANVAAEQERKRRLAELGFAPPPDETPEQEPAAAQEPERPQPRYLTAVASAILAAGVGAWLYLLVYKVTQIRVDLVAVAVGFLVGRAVLLGAGGRTNQALQWCAAVLSGLAVIVGQYLILRAVVIKQLGKALTELELFRLILDTAPKVGAVDVFLLVFVFFASLMAWRVSRDPQ